MTIQTLSDKRSIRLKSLEFIDKLRGVKSIPFLFPIVGDFIIDRYNLCRVERKNLEHSSLIYDHIDSSFYYGGATNVANIIGEFSKDIDGMVVRFYSGLGQKDPYIISRYGLDIPHNFQLCTNIDNGYTGRAVPVKTRFIDVLRKEYLARVDREPNKEEFSGFSNYLDRKLLNGIFTSQSESIFISDYNKRFLSEMMISELIFACSDRNIYCNIRPNLIERYRSNNIKLISFNQHEFLRSYEIIFKKSLDIISTDNIKEFKNEVGTKELIITFGSRGFMHCSNGSIIHIEPIKSLDVGSKNIIGAGDMISASYAFFDTMNRKFFLDKYELPVILDLVNVSSFLKVYTGNYTISLEMVEDYMNGKLALVWV